jgi:hypothetical protein
MPVIPPKTATESFFTDKGNIEVESNFHLQVGNKVYVDGAPAPDGEYVICLWFINIKVKNGVIHQITY